MTEIHILIEGEIIQCTKGELRILWIHPIYDFRYFSDNGYFREKFEKSYKVGFALRNDNLG